MATILPIIKVPNDSLRKKSLKISEKDIKNGAYVKLGEDMVLTMSKKDGVGLAAPQIGQNIRLITINTKNGPLVIFNPKILKKSLLKEWGEEGCLSVPEIFGQVKRHKKIKCTYVDKEGNFCELDASGFMARILQHEIDHLDGILFIDKAKDLKKTK